MCPLRQSNSKRGRKNIYGNEKKKSHNVSITPSGWDGLNVIANEHNIKSISQFLEKIGRREITIKNSKSDRIQCNESNFLIERICEQNHPLRISIIAFVARLLKQFDQCGFDESKSGEDIDEIGIGLISTNIKKSIQILIWIKSTHPNYVPNSTYCLLRWLTYKIISKHREEPIDSLPKSCKFINAENLEYNLWKIHKVINQLKNRHTNLFQIINLRYFCGQSWKSIVDILSISNSDITEYEVLEISREARQEVRKIFHSLDNKEIKPPKQMKKPWPKEAEDYYRLSLQDLSQLPEAEINAIERILMLTIHDRKLDFWITEIDHILGHEQGVLTTSVREGASREIYETDLGIKDTILESKRIYKERISWVDCTNSNDFLDQLVTEEVGKIDINRWISFEYLSLSYHEDRETFMQQYHELLKYENQSDQKSLNRSDDS